MNPPRTGSPLLSVQNVTHTLGAQPQVQVTFSGDVNVSSLRAAPTGDGSIVDAVRLVNTSADPRFATGSKLQVGPSGARIDIDGMEAIQAGGTAINLGGASCASVLVADYNADGIPDLLVGAADGLVRLYQGTTASGPLQGTAQTGQPGRIYVDTFQSLGADLDADGNGKADALTDGILILRYLFDPAGQWNYSDALGSSATRTTRTQLKAFLDLFSPSLPPTPGLNAAGMAAPTIDVAPIPRTVTGVVQQNGAHEPNRQIMIGANVDDQLIAGAASATLPAGLGGRVLRNDFAWDLPASVGGPGALAGEDLRELLLSGAMVYYDQPAKIIDLRALDASLRQRHRPMTCEARVRAADELHGEGDLDWLLATASDLVGLAEPGETRVLV